MIDVRELQVGSYVQDPNGKLMTLKDVNKTLLVCESLYRIRRSTIMLDATYSIEDLHPIPITTEWLEKLNYRLWAGNPGSVATYTLNVPEPAFAVLHWRDEAKVYEYDENAHSGIGNYIASVKSVHHLQSLVFSLERIWLTLPQAK